MSVAFVILAAGRGTRIGRVGETLHKALAPLGPQAVLSHLLELRPPDSHVIICTGHREEQLQAYVRLAHPSLTVQFIHVDGWDLPGGGPGWSLLSARDVIQPDDDLVFTSCDTLWAADDTLWTEQRSWSAVAAVPAGTSPTRWCRLAVNSYDVVQEVIDKRPGPDGPAYVGLTRVTADDLPEFWNGVSGSDLLAGETQVSGGLDALALQQKLVAQHVRWTDVGDENAYRRAVAKFAGYDWTKLGEATYVLPTENRVVKFWADPTVREARQRRAQLLGDAVPSFVESQDGMLAYQYVHGEIAYETAEYDAILMDRIMRWAEDCLWRKVNVSTNELDQACLTFYRDKTLERIAMLPSDLRVQCDDVVSRINWDDVVLGGEAVTFHGDLNMGNLVTWRDRFVGIDWRQDFAGHDWGDKRYDVAKLLAGTVVHWEHARRGDFRPWPQGEMHAEALREWIGNDRGIELIGALSLLNSAPLHATPLDAVLVARGVGWLEEIL